MARPRVARMGCYGVLDFISGAQESILAADYLTPLLLRPAYTRVQDGAPSCASVSTRAGSCSTLRIPFRATRGAESCAAFAARLHRASTAAPSHAPACNGTPHTLRAYNIPEPPPHGSAHNHSRDGSGRAGTGSHRCDEARRYKQRRRREKELQTMRTGIPCGWGYLGMGGRQRRQSLQG